MLCVSLRKDYGTNDWFIVLNSNFYQMKCHYNEQRFDILIENHNHPH